MSDNGKQLEYQHQALPHKFVITGIVIFVAGLIWMLAAFLVDPLRAKYNYLIMLAFTGSIVAGSLFLIAIEYIGGADWSTPLRRIPEFLTGMLLPLSIMAIPFIFFIPDIYHWAHMSEKLGDIILLGKLPYLNVPFFIVRYALIFLLWYVFYLLFTHNSFRQDVDGDQIHTRNNIRLSAIFMFVFAATITTIAVDWIMSLEPHWYSTIFGVYYFSGTVVAALALTSFVGVNLYNRKLLHPRMKIDSFYSLGTLMFAFNIFWAYIAFSQYLLIWYANLPEETFWFIDRMQHGWGTMSTVLIIVHFVIPFFLLLLRSTKTNLNMLRFTGLWLMMAHYFDLYWLIMPTFSKTEVVLGWMEFGFPLIPAGFAMFVFAWQSKRRNLVPIKDPKLERGLHFHL